jgi:hypothetical protein
MAPLQFHPAAQCGVGSVRLLLYCIFASSPGPLPEGPTGVDGLPVHAIFAGGLGAAVSEIARDELKPNVERALAYGKAVEIFHRYFTVVPLRYGSSLQDEAAVLNFLSRNEKALKRLLQKLKDCVEMGIRITVPKNQDENQPAREWFDNPENAGNAPGIRSGKSYLESRKRAFSDRNLLEKRGRQAVENCKAALKGLYVDMKVEIGVSVPQSVLFKPEAGSSATEAAVVHFLVPRDRMEAFYTSFDTLCVQRDTHEMYLSGPWPPYNFAVLSFRQ